MRAASDHVGGQDQYRSATAAALSAFTPVSSVGWGTGAKRLVCRPGGSVPAARAVVSVAGSMAFRR